MDLSLLMENLTNPALLFFFLGLIAVRLKSDLEIPANSAKFISIYLLFAIGFKGGQELAHSHLNSQAYLAILFGVGSAIVIPFLTYFVLRKKLDVPNSAAIAASYGSVSAVTFITAIAFLESMNHNFGGHMVAIMAMMEAPAIIIGVLLLKMFSKKKENDKSTWSSVKHALTNGSVLLIVGSLFIGYVASDAQAQGIKPFTTDIFKGFLAVFLLDMGIQSGKKIKAFIQNGWFTVLFSVLTPLIIGSFVAFVSGYIDTNVGNRFLLTILTASASYIAVPASMKIAAPKANPSLYIPMALAVTFPVNITIGMPIYISIITAF